MNNATLQLKLKQRLNKLDSQDYDNIEPWQMIEAFNKAQLEWCRRNLHGNNPYKEGDEGSKKRIDDLQILLTELPLTGLTTDDYFESDNFPGIDSYLEYKRVSTNATTECCTDPRSMTVYLAEVGNVDLILRDPLKRPDFEWGETFCTLINGQIRIYRNTSFNIVSPLFTFYRAPRLIQIAGVQDPYSGVVSAVDVECEFKDDLAEIFIDETAGIIAGDISNFNQMSIAQQSAEKNN
tara:strand:- start:3169 stop:3879 length:711 start_codon:yes stop_codon:yes gene_type:complete